MPSLSVDAGMKGDSGKGISNDATGLEDAADGGKVGGVNVGKESTSPTNGVNKHEDKSCIIEAKIDDGTAAANDGTVWMKIHDNGGVMVEDALTKTDCAEMNAEDGTFGMKVDDCNVATKKDHGIATTNDDNDREKANDGTVRMKIGDVIGEVKTDDGIAMMNGGNDFAGMKTNEGTVGIKGDNDYARTKTNDGTIGIKTLNDNVGSELTKVDDDILINAVTDNALRSLQEADPTGPCVLNIPQLTAMEVRKSRGGLDISGLKYGPGLGLVPKSQPIGFVSVADSVDASLGTQIKPDGDVVFQQVVDLSNGPPIYSKVIVEKKEQDKSICHRWRHLVIALLMAILLICLTVATLLYMAGDFDEGHKKYDPDSEAFINYTVRIVKRAQWSDHPDISFEDLPKQPAWLVVLSHTAGTGCGTTASCRERLNGIESWGMQNELGAIAYNFLIGGDGLIYEGRGWNKYGRHSRYYNCDSVGIGFIGEFNRNVFTPKMAEAFNILISEGRRRGALDKNYKIVTQKTLFGWASPGASVEMYMENNPHYSTNVTKEDECTDISTGGGHAMIPSSGLGVVIFFYFLNLIIAQE